MTTRSRQEGVVRLEGLGAASIETLLGVLQRMALDPGLDEINVRIVGDDGSERFVELNELVIASRKRLAELAGAKERRVR